MKKIAYDTVRLDAVKIKQNTKRHLKVNAVITAVGVYQYPDGRALKCAPELFKATRTARHAKLMIGKNHPETLVIMSQHEIGGGVENPSWDGGRKRITADLDFDKQYCPADVITDLENGVAQDVSIGFYYQPDFTPGTWEGQNYDYVSRDIVIDHVLVCREGTRGRCSYPTCGIGVDAVMRRIALDPFGEYADFADCVAKNQDKTDPEAFCAWLHKQITGQTPAQDNNKFEGGKRTMSETKTQEEVEAAFNECVQKRLSEGANADPPITREQAEALCLAPAEPEDEPGPVPQQLDQKKPCPQTAQEEPEAEPEKSEPTPLERCIASRMESEGVSEEEARSWCESELAGEHEAADALIERSQKLLAMREQYVIEQRRSQRRHPL